LIYSVFTVEYNITNNIGVLLTTARKNYQKKYQQPLVKIPWKKQPARVAF